MERIWHRCTYANALIVLILLLVLSTPIKPVSATHAILEPVATGLDTPWSLVFLNRDTMLVTERSGRIRIIEGGIVQGEAFAQLPAVEFGEGGLLGLALHPNYPDIPYVYTYYTYTKDGQIWNRVARLTDVDRRGTDETVILDNIPGERFHNGGRIKFGPDGKLYIATGDAMNTALPQDLQSLAGKILRINDDGSIPIDNPIPGSPIYSYGHRNSQGLAWHPVTGQLYASEHGNITRDEINRIVAGGNYGWPEVSGVNSDVRFINPVTESAFLTWAPSGMTFYSGNQWSSWQNHLFVATLRGVHLRRIIIEDASMPKITHEIVTADFGRLRDVVEGPDGNLYVLTNNQDGRGTKRIGDDKILRIRFTSLHN